MHLNTKIPEGVTSISELMEMEKEEILAWPYYPEFVSLVKDYNLKAIKKPVLLERLLDLSVRCAEDRIYHYSTGLDKAIFKIKAFY